MFYNVKLQNQIHKLLFIFVMPTIKNIYELYPQPIVNFS